MSGFWCHASGIIIITACSIERPVIASSSRALSNWDESDPVSSSTGTSLAMSAPKCGLRNLDWRARIQFTLPRSVLISPLCADIRNGCARSQRGRTLVEKRACTSASVDVEPRVAQIGVEAGELRGGEHPLVDERAAREARPVERLASDAGGERGALDDPAEDEEPSIRARRRRGRSPRRTSGA